MTNEEPNYKKLYEEAKEAEEEREKRLATEARWKKEIDDERKFTRWFFIIFFGYIIIGLYACGPSDSGYGPGCYDADPTQYVDVYCE
jgi:hypothetical protein